ncbi:E3 ubiquitin-protein ligase TRIM58-like [Podarcis lilfordi]|uniref:E3 ubiquitin-protein ligase TRIM58-like n=1 Tax=Podarcis lilfordi TaxID=74358 RepID=A0AA35NUV4_9SAUR|nr:E3 ubiquitin-protein ligase TRIM58-like [Podarcis lilfordi]
MYVFMELIDKNAFVEMYTKILMNFLKKNIYNHRLIHKCGELSLGLEKLERDREIETVRFVCLQSLGKGVGECSCSRMGFPQVSVDQVGGECRTGWVSLWSDPMASSAFCVCPWQEKVEERRALIVSGYERRRQAMAEEEQLLLRQLQDEAQETLKKLQVNWAFLLGQCTRLRDLISEMEQKCQQPAASLLKDVKVALTRSEDVSLQEPQPISMDLQDLYDVPGLMESLQRYSVPVTFDPDTANPYLLLSDNLLCVQVGDQKQDLPKSLSRFETCTCLLGCQQFTTGRHYWEVCVESKTSWTLGVCRESVSRQGIFTPSPATGFWTVWLRNGNEYAALTSPLTELALRARPGAIGIFLDYDAGEVSFYNADNGSHIFTFADSFSGPLRPYFYPGVWAGGLNNAPLIIRPASSKTSGKSCSSLR